MIYIVQSGDTLSQICETLFKDSMEMYALAELNGIKNIDIIQVGQVLRLHKVPSRLVIQQKAVNVNPSYAKIDQIIGLFKPGFCDEAMAHEIYKTVIS